MGTTAQPADPEIIDPAGDVMLEGVVPLDAGWEWADLLALWYEVEPDLAIMRIRLAAADEIPPPGEVAAHIQIGDDHHLVGFTTVLPPFATGVYQGGFHCGADPAGMIDPNDCTTLANVSLSLDVLDVPLPFDAFGIEESGLIETHNAYAGAWYLDVQTRFDETGPGRAYRVPPGDEDPAGELEAIPDEGGTPQGADSGESTRVEERPVTREAPMASFLSILITVALTVMIGRLMSRRILESGRVSRV